MAKQIFELSCKLLLQDPDDKYTSLEIVQKDYIGLINPYRESGLAISPIKLSPDNIPGGFDDPSTIEIDIVVKGPIKDIVNFLIETYPDTSEWEVDPEELPEMYREFTNLKYIGDE